jgi:hypothetical protein
MDVVKVGYYDRRQRARVPIDRGDIKAAYSRHPPRLRVEIIEDALILTDIADKRWIYRND